jgi:hypothetical protein
MLLPTASGSTARDAMCDAMPRVDHLVPVADARCEMRRRDDEQEPSPTVSGAVPASAGTYERATRDRQPAARDKLVERAFASRRVDVEETRGLEQRQLGSRHLREPGSNANMQITFVWVRRGKRGYHCCQLLHLQLLSQSDAGEATACPL